MSRFPTNLFAGKRFAVVGLGRNGLPAARRAARDGAPTSWHGTTTWQAARRCRRRHVARPARGRLRVRCLVLSPGIPHLLPHRIRSRRARARRRADPVGRRKCCSARSAARARARASSASPAPTASPPRPRCLLTFLQAPAGRSRPAAISARPHCRSDCCRTAGSTSWKCRPTCWSDSPRSASMRRRCSTSARTIWIATATWRDMSRRSD